MMSGMSLHSYTKGVPIGRQISILWVLYCTITPLFAGFALGCCGLFSLCSFLFVCLLVFVCFWFLLLFLVF